MTPTRRSFRRPLGALVGAALILAGLVPAAVPSVLAVSTTLVINEIDYDQPGTDASEFVELKNVSGAPIDLDAYAVVLVNGTGGGAAAYLTVDLPSTTLSSGDYFVICASATTTANCDLDVTPETNLIQNGAPDAVAVTLGAAVVDTVSYEGDTGAPYTERSGAGLEDTGAEGEGLSRCPDGVDTDVNNVDFQLRPITPGLTNACATVDAAPTVVSTFPAEGATGVTTNAVISLTFSEPVNVDAAGVGLECTGGPLGATLAGGPTTFTLTPLPMPDGPCTVSVAATSVTDQDTDDPPNSMAADFMLSFMVGEPPNVCDDPFTPIYDIQGDGSAAAITGNLTTRGVVVGDFEGSAGLSGFYLQDATGDADAATSDGIFVFTGSANLVDAGDLVRVTGFGRERFNQTTINGSNINGSAVPAANIVDCGTGSVSPADVTMPFAALDFPERYEGMLVRLPQALVISEYFNYERFGEMVLALPLAGETRPFTPTVLEEPGADAQARALANSLRRITLDDGLSVQNPNVVRHPNGSPFSLTNRFRGGDTVANTVGVLGFDFSLYRIQPTGPADYTAVNPRPAAPEDIGGSLRVAAMNMLNFFLTPDNIQESSSAPDNPADNLCGPGPSLECRGWDGDQPDELTRQRVKLLAALAGLDADVIGLNEMENTTGVDPLGDPDDGIVAGLNAMFGPGSYAAIDTGTIGTDAIKVGLIYRPAAVTPVGGFEILDSSDDPRFIDTLSRPVLAQTFMENATGATFTVAVNHLKSKGSACPGDPDIGDGQGNCNLTREAAAQALVDWLATDPTGSGDRDYLIIGDLNSYAMEDPIDAVKAGPDDTPGTDDDYTNLIEQFVGQHAYSFVFDGQAGYLDHALASPTLAAQVTGATEWHINADEADLLDYDTSFKPLAQDAIFEPNAFRSSDHDPVIIGLNLLNLEVDFGPFAPPVVGPPGSSVAKAGSVVSVRFGLDGDSDLDSFFGVPQTYRCGMPGADRHAAATAGGSGFRFDDAADQYLFAWKTMKAWADSCRTIEFVLDDGTYETASVTFRK